MNLSNS